MTRPGMIGPGRMDLGRVKASLPTLAAHMAWTRPAYFMSSALYWRDGMVRPNAIVMSTDHRRSTVQ